MDRLRYILSLFCCCRITGKPVCGDCQPWMLTLAWLQPQSLSVIQRFVIRVAFIRFARIQFLSSWYGTSWIWVSRLSRYFFSFVSLFAAVKVDDCRLSNRQSQEKQTIFQLFPSLNDQFLNVRYFFFSSFLAHVNPSAKLEKKFEYIKRLSKNQNRKFCLRQHNSSNELTITFRKRAYRFLGKDRRHQCRCKKAKEGNRFLYGSCSICHKSNTTASAGVIIRRERVGSPFPVSAESLFLLW